MIMQKNYANSLMPVHLSAKTAATDGDNSNNNNKWCSNCCCCCCIVVVAVASQSWLAFGGRWQAPLGTWGKTRPVGLLSYSWQLWPTTTITTTTKIEESGKNVRGEGGLARRGVSKRTEEVGASVLLSTWPRLICRQGHWSASETETDTETERDRERERDGVRRGCRHCDLA